MFLLIKLLHKHYSKLVPRVLLEIDPRTLLKIVSMSVTQNRLTNVTQKLVPQVLLEIDSQTLLKIGFTNVSQN